MTGSRTACAPGCRTPTATASTRSPRISSRPAIYEFKVALDEGWDGQLRRRWCAGRPQHRVHGGGRRDGDVQLRRRQPHAGGRRVDRCRPGAGRRGARAAGAARAVHRRDPLLHDPRPVRRRQPEQRLRRLRRALRPRRHAGERADARIPALGQGLLPRWRPRRPAGAAPLSRGPRHHVDLGRTDLQEQERANRQRQPLRALVRVPRLLDRGLPRRRSAPRDQRTSSAPSSRMPTAAASRC